MPVRRSQSPNMFVLVAEMAVALVLAFEDCGEKMRILFAAGMVEDEFGEVQSANFMRKAFSRLGTVRCMIHFHPSLKFPFGVAVVRIASIPVTASVVVAVDVADAVVKVISAEMAVVDAVVVAVVEPAISEDCTAKW